MCGTGIEFLVLPDDAGFVRPTSARIEVYDSWLVLTRLCARTWESHRCKVLTSRYSELSVSLDNIIGDANAQLTGLQNKVASKSQPDEYLGLGATDISEA